MATLIISASSLVQCKPAWGGLPSSLRAFRAAANNSQGRPHTDEQLQKLLELGAVLVSDARAAVDEINRIRCLALAFVVDTKVSVVSLVGKWVLGQACQ